MYTGQLDVISNKATWQSDTYELEDEDDGTVTDLTNPDLAVDIVVTIRELRSGQWERNPNSCILATASIANGKVTIPGPGFEWRFEVSDLSNICAGTYEFGAKVTVDNFVIDLIIGTIAVMQGN